MADFFAMGGYAFYVWGSYLIVALVLGGLFFWSVQQLKSRRAALERLKAQEQTLGLDETSHAQGASDSEGAA